MMESKQSIDELANRLTDPFSHAVLGQVDNYCAYLTHMRGPYIFHQHTRDEMYLVLEGEITIEYVDGRSVTVGHGESLVVRAGERHRSLSHAGALVLMFKALDMFAE